MDGDHDEEMTIEQRAALIRQLAGEQHGEHGVPEIEEDAEISEGDSNGAYVAAWVWGDFSGSPLDKEAVKTEQP